MMMANDSVFNHFDYPDSRFSRLFTQIPTTLDNRGSAVVEDAMNDE